MLPIRRTFPNQIHLKILILLLPVGGTGIKLTNNVEVGVVDYVKLDLELYITRKENKICNPIALLSDPNATVPIDSRTGNFVTIHIKISQIKHYLFCETVLKTLYKAMNLLRMNADSASSLLDIIR